MLHHHSNSADLHTGSSDNREYELMYLQPQWVQRETEAEQAEPLKSPILLFALRDQPLLLNEGAARNHQVIVVYPGSQYNDLGNGQYEIHPQHTEELEPLFDALQAAGLLPKHLVYLWPMEAAGLDETALTPIAGGKVSLLDRMEDSLNAGIYPIYGMLQYIIRRKLKGLSRMLVGYPAKGESPDPLYESIGSLGHSLSYVWPELRFSAIQLSHKDLGMDFICRELDNARHEQEILYKQGKRYIKELQSIRLPENNVRERPKGSTYLITGGTGALGLLFSRHLARSEQAKLVLLGRSAPGPEKREAIKELEQFGSRVVCLQGDVSDRAQMEKVIQLAKEAFGHIDGVIHAAGLMSDKLIHEKSLEDAKAIVQAKIKGTIVLDEVTKDEPLERFVLFSSTASLLGDFGQCDYALGNRFLDSYGHFRNALQAKGARQGQTLTINWPLWAEGGMHQDQGTERLYLSISGMDYLQNEDGIQAYENILRSGRNQVMVLYGDASKVKGFAGTAGRPSATGREDKLYRKEGAPMNNQTDSPGAGEREAVRQKLEGGLKAIAARLLKIGADQMDAAVNIGEYGFDSISLKSFADQIGQQYGIETSPTLFFSSNTIGSLAEHLMSEYPDQIRAHYKGTEEAGSAGSTEPKKTSKAAPRPGNSLVPLRYRLTGGKETVSANLKSAEYEPVAVIGINGIFPGSKDLNEFWRHLEEGKDLITEIPVDRWDWRAFYSTDPAAKNKSVSHSGGFIPDVDKFDASFFNISPREAEVMDPQQRLLLQSVWKTAEDGGQKASGLWGKNIGVFIGFQFNDYQELLQEQGDISPQLVVGNAHAILANRISYYMNFRGPSESIDTACSSGLVAIHRAVQSIQSGESEMAFAGGISLMLSPTTTVSASKLGILSKDNRCKTFDKSANGYVRGEGVGTLLLKPLSKAIADRDPIHAVIKGSAENHGGRANSLTAPNPDAQAEVIIRAYEKAGISPDTITYIEAHGTGTELGDPIEIEGLKKAFTVLYPQSDTPAVKHNYCGIGSVKTNIGHLEPAAGIAGILKVILALKHKTLPASIHCQEVNPYISLAKTPFYIVDHTKRWESTADHYGKPVPRRAGVSSFGFGGTNAHVVLEEYEETEEVSGVEEPQIIVLSAKNRERLADYARDLLAFLEQAEQAEAVSVVAMSLYRDLASAKEKSSLSLGNIAYTLQLGREAMAERMAVIVHDVNELKDYLRQYADGLTPADGKFFVQHVKEAGQGYELFKQDEDARDMMRQWASKKKLDKIARLWVSGCEIDWEWLHAHTGKVKLSLPTYPFKKERHWIAASRPPVPGLPTGGMSPLLDSIAYNLSLDEGIVFDKELDGKLLAVTQDHVIQGQHVFPGTGYLEMAYQGAAVIWGHADFHLRRVFWMNPLIVGENKQKIVLGFTKAEEKLLFEVKGFEHGQYTQLYAKGEVHVGEKPEPQRVSLEEIRSRCTEIISGEDVYRQYEAQRIQYGPSFRAITEVFAARDEALGVLQIPADGSFGFHAYALHPGLLDSALQVIGCIKDAGHKVYLPFAVERVELLRPLQTGMYAYVQASGEHSYHVALLDKEGYVCLKFHHFTLKESKDAYADLYYRLAWRDKPINSEADPTGKEQVQQADSSVLIIYADGGQPIAERIAAHYQHPKLLKLGAINKKRSENHREIKADNPAALAKYMSGITSLDTVYMLSGLQTAPMEVEDRAALYDSQEKGVMSLFRLVQAMDRQGLWQPGRLKLLTNNIYPIGSSAVVLPAAAAMHGFIKSLAKEYPKLNVSSLDMDLNELGDLPTEEDMEAWLAPIWTEPPHPNGETIAYRKGKRYERVIEHTQVPRASESAIREKGVYIIIGGAGGIGLALSRYLSQKAGARLFLIGRSELNEAVQAKLGELEALGGEAVYHQGDITSEESLKQAVAAAKARFGAIHGVFHSAIVSADKTIKNLSEHDFYTSVAPKIAGSQVLYSVLRHEKLDFMAFFSSTSAVVGMPGQSNYVSGLNFKDAFAHYIQEKTPYPVKIFNWGFWGLGSSEGDAYGKRLRQQGIHAISIEEGMETVERVLQHPCNQLFILKADQQVLEQIGVLKREEQSRQPEPFMLPKAGHLSELHPPVPANTGKKDQAEQLEEFLRDLLSTTLKMDPHRLERLASFDELGIDSLLGLELHAHLEKSFGELPPALLFEFRTLADLTRYFLEHHRDKLDALFVPQAEADPLTQASGQEERFSGQTAGEAVWEETREAGELGPMNEKPDIELPVNIESFMVETEPNISMEVSVSGEGEPILIVPGFAVTFLIHAYQIKDWSKSYKVISINLPGHGKSDITDDLSCSGIARLMVQVMDKLGITQPMHVVGGSFGGMIAQWIAKEFPERVRTLSLLASFTLSKFEGVAQYFSFVEAVAKDFETVRQNSRAKTRLDHIEYGFQLYKLSQVTNGKIMLEYLEMMKKGMTTRDILDQIKVPALVIGGAVDSVVDPEESKIIHAGLENSRYIQIKDGGHFINLTHPDRVNRSVMHFIQEHAVGLVLEAGGRESSI